MTVQGGSLRNRAARVADVFWRTIFFLGSFLGVLARLGFQRRLYSLSRYIDRLSNFQSISKTLLIEDLLGLSSADPSSIPYSRLLTEADTHYQRGEFSKSVSLLLGAYRLNEEICEGLGFPKDSPRFVGSEILDSIGHCAAALGMRATLSSADELESRDFWLLRETGANPAYIRLWKTFFPNLQLSKELASLFELEMRAMIESISVVRLRGRMVEQREAHNKAVKIRTDRNLPALLTVPPDYDSIGRAAFRSAGLDPDKPFICFHVRSGVSMGYGRDANIVDYIPAIELAISLGYQVIRLRSQSEPSLPTLKGLWDFSHVEPHSDVLSVYSLARCAVLVGTTSGPLYVSYSFERPIVWTNAPDLAKMVHFPNCIVLPKLLLDADGNLLRFRNIMTTPSVSLDSFLLDPQGIPFGPAVRWRDNSPSEICDALVGALVALKSPTAKLCGIAWPDYVPKLAGLRPPPVGPEFWDKWSQVLE